MIRHYYIVSILIIVAAIGIFVWSFEKRKPKTREIVTLGVLTGMAIVGRVIFFMTPQFKPCAAIIIITGIMLGKQSGFLCGCLTAFISDFFFGQGPWTPWQMFGMGIVGFLAGVLARTGWLRRSRGSLCAFGAVSAILIYGGILNTASALMAAGELNRGVLLTYYLAGFPMDCVHGLSTAAFLWLGAEPMLEKLERLKTKYGWMNEE